MTSATCDHKWREYTDEEMSTLRSQTRQGRPSGAWAIIHRELLPQAFTHLLPDEARQHIAAVAR